MNDSGDLPAADFFRLLTTQGSAPLSKDEAIAFFNDCDISHDGVFDWKHFLEVSFPKAESA